MLSPKSRRNIARVVPFGIIWLVAGLVFAVVERAALGGSASRPTGGITIDMSIFVFGMFAQTVVGLTVGALEVGYLSRAFSRLSFPRKIVSKAAFYTLLFAIVTVVTFPLAASLELDAAILDPRVWNRFRQYLTSMTHLSTDVQLGVTLAASLFYAEVSENVGHSVLANFFSGKYHRPTEEERIFMFVDMNASTAIAEKLGHTRYFELLAEYFADMADAIVSTSGEVYQYVGDEIVVSWRMPQGLHDTNCLRCFFAMRDDLAARAAWYEQRFGVVPTFKAGFHAGRVTTGEIGVLKRDIIFTGDVLNTTARIQGLCRKLDVDVLASTDLVGRLDVSREFEMRPLGAQRLRGRDEAIQVYTVEMVDG